ncbi:MAG: hypothetical protein HY690_00060 [Chloroflexi bacterium]|nr:hypothetical protein [Chloroflexota bacterium]
MVRDGQAIDRLLWIVLLASALLVLLRRPPAFARLRAQASAMLRTWTVLGRRLTVSKLAEALSLDFDRHRRAWLSLSRT